jgi:hypothetical protein
MTTNVLNLPGDYRIKANAGSGIVYIDADSVLGISTETSSVNVLARFISDLNPKTSSTYDLGLVDLPWKTLYVNGIQQVGTGGEGTIYLSTFSNAQNVANDRAGMGDPDYDWMWDGLYDTAANRQRAAVYIAGGLGIEKDLNVGGHIYGRIEFANTTTYMVFTATNAAQEFNLSFIDNEGPLDAESLVYIDTTGISNGLTYNPSLGRITTDRVVVAEAEQSISTTTGALIVAGGVGIAGTMTIGGSILPAIDATGEIGNTGTQWAEAYVQNLYTRIIGSTTGPISVKPASGMTDVYGDIRVRGTNPIGTSPVVTNVLYVTVDGDDTNDGRAMDPSRACRTIGGAINSQYYQPGTQIQVSAGHYLEDNPLEMKPYTSVKGSDIRTTFIEPINKTQDLWHMNSGCYLNYMNFLNGRSGLLAGEYTQGYNRGAYATAFPPQTGNNRIDLFQSPYVQNCTNQSGPWLKDGTMFVPSQTVQVPSAVGIGSWEANTTSIVVNIASGSISIGQSINPGQQNPGFFDARTLLLANKPFIQAQVVAFIDDTFNSGSFTYDQVKCARDTGLIVNAIATDMLYDSTSDSTFAGLQYWSQDTLTGQIPSEITATIAAITYLKSVALTYVNVSNQGEVGTLFDTVTGILSGGTVGVTGSIVYGGLPSTDPTRISDYQALQTNRATMQQDVLDWITINYPALVYTTSTCFRDVGYIVDSVSFDLLHLGNVQSTKSGVYYWGYNSTSVLPFTTATNEIAATTAAYNFIKNLMPNIVTGQSILSTYQTGTSQVIVGNPGSKYEVATLRDNIDVITSIIRTGADTVIPLPMALVENTATAVLNAYDIVIANIPFIQAEVIAFLNATMNNLTYNKQKSYRDAGILVENMAYDMAFGGNEKSVESGLAYWNGVVSVIPNSLTQCVSAIFYLMFLSQKIVVNEVCPILIPPLEIPAVEQVINYSFFNGAIAIPSIENLIVITTDIIENGPTVAPAIYNSTGPDAAYVSSEILLQANRTFIQENVINYINNSLCYPPKALPYNQIRCRRDAGVIIDSIASDLLFPTDWFSQSTFAGLQYYIQNSFVGAIKDELNPTIDAITYLRDLSVKVVQNITTATDALVGVTRYTDGIQTTASNYATSSEVTTIRSEFTNILSILNGRTTGWTDLIVPNGAESEFASVHNTVDLLLANTNYLAEEIVAFVNANNPGFTYSTSTCNRDVGYIIESVAFDLLYGGNRQGIQAGLSYYVSRTNESVIPQESTATVDAFTFLGNLSSTLVQGNAYTPRQTLVKVVSTSSVGTGTDAALLVSSIGVITDIITSGPSVVGPLKPITLTKNASTTTQNAYNILKANRAFIVAETVAYLDQTYNPNSFNYNQELCYRDTGLIIDAVSQDILLGGNQKSIEAGLSYWNQGYSYVAGQSSTTTLAINYARDLALQVIANTPVVPQTGTVATQVINTFFRYGGDFMPQQSINRNFGIITDIIVNGVTAAPPLYAGGGLFSLTGLNGSSVKLSPKVTAVDIISTGTYLIGMDIPTVGFGTDATLYFGDVHVFPQQDVQVEAASLELTGNASTWDQRKVDPIGSMGGSLVDGGVISDRSPIQSFVYDAFTQVNQGGRGVHVTNNGYAQLVSVFTIFCSIGVQCDNGGIASITNSNCNFGDISLLAKGYGSRKFSGTVYNPAYRSYPFSPNVPGGDYLDQFYPSGYWPNEGGRVEIFVPDSANRPHIGLVMEVIAPDGHTNEQSLATSPMYGFLNAQPSRSTLTTGTITITDVSTTDVYVGNNVYIRDDRGRSFDDNGVWYAATGTVVTDVNYNSITLNTALTSGGGDILNANYFTIYFSGNSYYTVQTSVVANSPYLLDNNILVENTNPYYQGPTISQVSAHVASLQYMTTLVDQIIANIPVTPLLQSTVTQVTTVLSGSSAQAFIDLRFGYLIDIVGAADISSASAIVPQSLITTSGTIPTGAGNAVILIDSNIDFIAAEMVAYVSANWEAQYDGSLSDNQKDKCSRDVKLILQQLSYDLQTGGNYNMVYSGLSYWSRAGTYHVVELGEAVTRPDLFPDGSTVNFYQRSYISASGYLFEYVGAGTNYGALPQRGVADPVQAKETVQLNSGKVFFTSTDQNGDFRIGTGLVISQATGVLSGRTFVQSLYANMTPFILAIE